MQLVKTDSVSETVAPLIAALRSCDHVQIKDAIFRTFSSDARIQLGHPFGLLKGPYELWERVYEPLAWAMPNFERRDFIVVSGPRWGESHNEDWVGIGGNFFGQLMRPWLGIPALGGPAYMRFHEYFRVVGDEIVEMQGLWDIPQLMRKQRVWPLAESLGYESMCPGPANGVGVYGNKRDQELSACSLQIVWDMLMDVQKGTAENPSSGLGKHWHEHANWHGPTGIGSARGHDAITQHIFRQFRDGLSENTRHLNEGVFFAQNDLVAFTGWPSGTAKHTGPGFLGMPPTNKTITRSSLDFWRIEDGIVRECWVMVDVLDLYVQMGVDALDRMKQLNS